MGKYKGSLLMAFCFLFLQPSANAQFLKKLKKTVEKSAENSVNRKAARKTEKAVDDLLDGKKGTKNSPKSNKNHPNSNTKGSDTIDSEGENKSPNEKDADKVDFEMYSKFDFEAGEKVIHYDNFERATLGDFPTGWNAMGSAEIVTLNNIDGKWLKLSKESGGIIPYQLTDFPENFTLEFDIIHDLDLKEYAYQRRLSFLLTSNDDPEDRVDAIRTSSNQMAFTIDGKVGGLSIVDISMEKIKDGKSNHGKSIGIGEHINKNSIGKPIHVSIWRQGKRVRVYMDHNKVYDIPLGWTMDTPMSGFRFFNQISNENENFLIGNLRMAVGAPDTRSKLITEGKLVTYGITFETNSAEVKPESYGTLKSIAEVLKSHPEVKIQIIGHTDSDGSDDYNLSLSTLRAKEVKATLHSNFGIDKNRIDCLGKGESDPISSNDSSAGKAQNRRVELIKL